MFSSFVTLPQYWQFPYHIIDVQKNFYETFVILNYIDCGFNDFDTTFLKNLILLFYFVFNGLFYFVVLVIWTFLYVDKFC